MKTFSNPVHGYSFPDPFVLKFRGEYFAYCTGFSSDGRVFGVLHSLDLVTWTPRPGAMEPLSTGEPFYWAPEVTYYYGKFYLYYSVGNETLMAIRVAVSDRPDRGFIDTGRVLTPQDFAIDAHVFIDEDSKWYMFYATDFLEHSHVGTGTVVDRMTDPFTLEGNPRPVTRPKHGWHLYERQRKEKGGVRWHTIEGPFVLKRKGIYYEMFSGGNWQNPSYGVSFAVSNSINRNEEWDQYSDGENVFPILRTVSESIIGPGHNSVVVGPNNRELYCVYHRWVNDERVLAIDRMDFAGDNRLFVLGPTDTPQPAPYMPQISDKFSGPIDEKWSVQAGKWKVLNSELVPDGEANNEINFDTGCASFRFEFWMRFRKGAEVAGVHFCSDNSRYALKLDPQGRHISLAGPDLEDRGLSPLGDEFDLLALHNVRVDVDHRCVKIYFDGIERRLADKFDSNISKIGFFSRGSRCAFSALSLTYGFEENYEDSDIGGRGWDISLGDGSLVVENQLLKIRNCGKGFSGISKRVVPGDNELVLNIRADIEKNSKGTISFGCGTAVSLFDAGGWKIRTLEETFRLDAKFNPDHFHQFRLITRGDDLEIFLDEMFLGLVREKVEESDLIQIRVQNASATFDMIRYTPL